VHVDHVDVDAVERAAPVNGLPVALDEGLERGDVPFPGPHDQGGVIEGGERRPLRMPAIGRVAQACPRHTDLRPGAAVRLARHTVRMPRPRRVNLRIM